MVITSKEDPWNHIGQWEENGKKNIGMEVLLRSDMQIMRTILINMVINVLEADLTFKKEKMQYYAVKTNHLLVNGVQLAVKTTLLPKEISDSIYLQLQFKVTTGGKQIIPLKLKEKNAVEIMLVKVLTNPIVIILLEFTFAAKMLKSKFLKTDF